MTFLNNFEFIIDLLFLLTLLIFSMKYFHIHFTTDLWKICDKTGNQVSIVSRNGQYWYIVSTPGLGKHQLETKINYRHKSISETKQRFETFQNFIKCWNKSWKRRNCRKLHSGPSTINLYQVQEKFNFNWILWMHFWLHLQFHTIDVV